MSKKDDDDNNLDDLHKQLRDLLNNKTYRSPSPPSWNQ